MNEPRFNFVSETSDGIGFAIRLQQQGYDVRCWIRSSDAKSVGDGLVPKVGDLEDLIHDANPDYDVFIFDVTGNGVIADYLRSNGFAVLGDSLLADRLERDRDFGAEIMRTCKIDVPKTVSFNSFVDGIKFVEKHSDVRWVYKPSKQLGDLSPSHVSYDAEDMIELLRNVERDVDIADPQFELQAFEKGVAFSTELWFQNGEFIAPLCNHTLERKELLNDDLGPSGGCLGNIVWMCDGCPVCDVAKQLVPWAERQRYHGMLDLNVIVSKTGIYGLEFTPRFGYDASPTLFWELIKGDMGQFFINIAGGTLRDVSTRDDQFAGAVRVTLPPWPSERYHAEENVPIRGLDKKDNVFLYNVKMNPENDQLVSAGAWGILLLLTNRATTVNGALRSITERARELRIKNKQLRTDLASQFNADLDKIEAIIKTNVRQ